MDAECLCRVCGISFDVSIYLDVIYSTSVFRMGGFFRRAKDAMPKRGQAREVERVNWKLISETRIYSFVYLFRVMRKR